MAIAAEAVQVRIADPGPGGQDAPSRGSFNRIWSCRWKSP